MHRFYHLTANHGREMMGFRQSYFALGELHPLWLIERLLHPYRQLAEVKLHDYPLRITATRRAANALARRELPLTVEMQLYFSCVIQKRVIFHEEGGLSGETATDKLAVLFRAVEALSCDPVAFAAKHPERRQLTSTAAAKMYPSTLTIDYRHGRWCGSFTI
jgi:hypothetical protein